MDFVKTLQSLEEAVYEVVTWVLFLPKTVFQVLVRPGWIAPYVSGEFDKKPDERFQAFLSPVLFWLILAVVPYAATSLNTDTTQLNVQVAIPDSSVLVSTALLLIAVPMWFALALALLKRLPVDRENLKRLFYMQCYPVGLYEILMLPLLLRIALRGDQVSGLVLTVSQVSLWVGTAWFLLAEVLIFRQELKVPWWKSIAAATLVTGTSDLILIVVLTAYVAFLLATGAMHMPGQ